MSEKYQQENFICPICERIVPDEFIEKHHLVPKARKGRQTAQVCCNCGDMIHKVISNKNLEKQYNTIAKISKHPEIKKWIKWISKRPNKFSVCMSHKKRKK